MDFLQESGFLGASISPGLCCTGVSLNHDSNKLIFPPSNAVIRTGEVAQSGGCLPGIHKVLGLNPIDYIWPCTGVIPPLRRWKQEGQESKFIPSDILRMRPAWTSWDPAADRTDHQSTQHWWHSSEKPLVLQ